MSEPSFNIGEYARQLVEGYGRVAEVSAELEASRFHRAILALDVAYRRAALDPETKIPSYMEAAVYVLVAMLPQTSAAPQRPAMATSGEAPFLSTSADAAQDAINRYAEHFIRTDQRERLEGSSAQTRSGGEGIDPRNGGTLKAGS